MVHSFFDNVHDKLLDTKNQVAACAAVLFGWAWSIYSMLPASGLAVVFSWEFLIKTLFGIIISVVTTMAVLLTTDIYKNLKPKAILFINKKYALLKLKFSKNGKDKKTKTEDRAA